jgi:spore protease
VKKMSIHTDLAMEERELWQRDADEQTQLPGVWARESVRKGVRTTIVKILDRRGAEALHKPVGTYLTLELSSFSRREPNSFARAVHALAAELRRMMEGREQILVAGLGNRGVTPDSIGPEALRSLIVTRHLKQSMPAEFQDFRSVSAAEPGVLGTTGVESAELVRGAAERVKPDLIVVVDALATCSLSRVCSVIQIADTGIVPGSGIGCSRAAFNEQTLGAPVLAVGVPSVVEAGAFFEAQKLPVPKAAAGMIVTPRDVDARVREISRVVGYGLDLALHRGLTLEDVPCFLP